MHNNLSLRVFYFVYNAPISNAQFKKSFVSGAERQRYSFFKMHDEPFETLSYPPRNRRVEPLNVMLRVIRYLESPWSH